jgi:CDP-diacylglycerol--serine O-phosphatidyltransferase
MVSLGHAAEHGGSSYGPHYRVLIPNGLTFLSLLSGTSATLVAAAIPTAADAPSYLWAAGLLVLASYLIDGCDGALARTLHASTAFGLQLDSLVDMVSLGVAPAVVLFGYGVRVIGVSPWLSGPVVARVPLASAFRLARFNLLPPKTTSHTDSVGLTISTGGALLTLAVLSNLAGTVAPSPVLYAWSVREVLTAASAHPTGALHPARHHGIAMPDRGGMFRGVEY